MQENNGQDRLLEAYIFETLKLLEHLEEICLKIEKSDLIAVDSINEMFRIMHTLKSSSAMMDYSQISVLAHSIEDIFNYIRENNPKCINCDDIFDLVLSGIDYIRNEIANIQNSGQPSVNNDNLVSKSSLILKAMKTNNGESEKPEEMGLEEDNVYYKNTSQSSDQSNSQKFFAKVYFEERCKMENIRAFAVVHELKNYVSEMYHIPYQLVKNRDTSKVIIENGFDIYLSTSLEEQELLVIINKALLLKSIEIKKISQYPTEVEKLKHEYANCNKEPKVAGDKNKIEPVQNNTIGVNTTKLDILLNLVEEIQVYEAIVTKNPNLEGEQLTNFKNASKRLGKLTKELQDVVMSIRMVSLGSTFNNLNRIVRDMSKSLNKEVELEIKGEDTEVDKSIVECIVDPLRQLIRNSIDHGIENKEERLASGKPEVGKITIETKNDYKNLVIKIKDDGRGLDKEKIYDKAKKLGFISKNRELIADEELISYILLPGFTINDSVSQYSGRGVGLDIVKKNIDILGGKICIQSEKGNGFEAIIKIPLALSIIQGLLVIVGVNHYIIPIRNVKEYFNVKDNQIIIDDKRRKKIVAQDSEYPIYNLYKLFNIKKRKEPSSDHIAVIIEEDEKFLGIFVDEIIGERKVLVKTIPKDVQKSKVLTGCTILDDGEISLVLDVNSILKLGYDK
jgi:two-component system chemotaxis sensor kinase CheA